MRIKCDYCKSMVEDKFVNCPNCGAALNVSRWATDVPKTIGELKEWYEAHNLPDEEITRFFIGRDVRENKSFGIYKNMAGDFIVYKITSDGSRKIRYEGSDEEYAVNELYQKLKAEISNQKEHSKDYGKIRPKSYNEENESSESVHSRFDSYEEDYQRRQREKNQVEKDSVFKDFSKETLNFLKKIDYALIGKVLISFICVALFVTGVCKFFVFAYNGVKAYAVEQKEYLESRPPEGYYTYNDTEYCYYGHSWFKYNEGLDDWDIEYSAPIDDVINNENYTEFAIPYEVYSTYGPEGHDAFDYNVWSDKHSNFRSNNYSNNRNSWSYYDNNDDSWNSNNNNSWSYSYDKDDDDDDFWGGDSNSYSYDSDDDDSWSSYNNNSWSYDDDDDDSWYSGNDSWYDSDDDWSDWDSDSTWDSGYDSWDSGYTDWGSDW